VTGAADVVAVVLAGGQARRMGGGDKGFSAIAGRPMLAFVLDRIAPQVRAVALSANGDPARFAAWNLPVLPDAEPLGPLAGILAGMRWAAQQHPGAALLSVPTDTPLLPPDLVARLAAARGAGVACASSGGRLHPVVALWPVALVDTLAQALAAGERGVWRFASAHGLTVADFPAAPVDPFVNVNDPATLATVAALL
jgi:molybdopterin-guanine dinucleotide biosynthesis protein A